MSVLALVLCGAIPALESAAYDWPTILGLRLGFTVAEVGLLAILQSLFSLLTTFFAGRWADHGGHGPVLCASSLLLLSSAGFFVTGLRHGGFVFFATSRVLFGSADWAFVSAFAIVQQRCAKDAQSRGRIDALILVVYFVGFAVPRLYLPLMELSSAAAVVTGTICATAIASALLACYGGSPQTTVERFASGASKKPSAVIWTGVACVGLHGSINAFVGFSAVVMETMHGVPATLANQAVFAQYAASTALFVPLGILYDRVNGRSIALVFGTLVGLLCTIAMGVGLDRGLLQGNHIIALYAAVGAGLSPMRSIQPFLGLLSGAYVPDSSSGISGLSVAVYQAVEIATAAIVATTTTFYAGVVILGITAIAAILLSFFDWRAQQVLWRR